MSNTLRCAGRRRHPRRTRTCVCATGKRRRFELVLVVVVVVRRRRCTRRFRLVFERPSSGFWIANVVCSGRSCWDSRRTGPRRGAPPRSSERRRTLGAILDVRRARETTVEIGSRRSGDERKRWNKLDERDEKRESDGGVVRPKPVRRAFFLQLPTAEKKEDKGEETRPEQGGYFCFFPNPLKLRNETTTTRNFRRRWEKAACFRGRFSKERKEKEWWLATTKRT